MIKTAIRYYIVDFALSHVFDTYIREFKFSKYITHYDLNESYLYKYLHEFNDGVESYKEGSKWHYGHTVVNLQIVPENEVGHLMKPDIKSDYWVVLRMRTKADYYPAIVLPFVDDCMAMLK